VILLQVAGAILLILGSLLVLRAVSGADGLARRRRRARGPRLVTPADPGAVKTAGKDWRRAA
jgi:hypothetical protein